jgi:hypothetical protein
MKIEADKISDTNIYKKLNWERITSEDLHGKIALFVKQTGQKLSSHNWE